MDFFMISTQRNTHQIYEEGDTVADGGEGEKQVRERRDCHVGALEARAALVPVANLN